MNKGIPRPFRILVVDDERSIAFTLRAILKQQGYEADYCLNSDKAIEKARSLLPDLLITDIDLAGANGAETALRIKRIAPGCKVLLISGHVSLNQGAQALLERPDFSFLAKPFQIPTLIREINRVLSSAPSDDRNRAIGSERKRYIAGGKLPASASFPSRQESGGGFVSSSTASPIPIDQAQRYSMRTKNLGDSGCGSADSVNSTFNAELRLVDALEQHCTSVLCDNGFALFAQNDSPTGIYVLHQGTVVLEMRDEDGRILVRIELSPLSILGLSGTIANQSHRFSAIARPGSKLNFIAREQFEIAFRSSDALYPPLLHVMAKEICSVRQAMSELVSHPVRKLPRPPRAATRLMTSRVSSIVWVN